MERVAVFITALRGLQTLDFTLYILDMYWYIKAV